MECTEGFFTTLLDCDECGTNTKHCTDKTTSLTCVDNNLDGECPQSHELAFLVHNNTLLKCADGHRVVDLTYAACGDNCATCDESRNMIYTGTAKRDCVDTTTTDDEAFTDDGIVSCSEGLHLMKGARCAVLHGNGCKRCDSASDVRVLLVKMGSASHVLSNEVRVCEAPTDSMTQTRWRASSSTWTRRRRLDVRDRERAVLQVAHRSPPHTRHREPQSSRRASHAGHTACAGDVRRRLCIRRVNGVRCSEGNAVARVRVGGIPQEGCLIVMLFQLHHMHRRRWLRHLR